MDLLGVGTGSIRPELESMRNEVKTDNDLVVQFDTIDDLIMIQRERVEPIVTLRGVSRYESVMMLPGLAMIVFTD